MYTYFDKFFVKHQHGFRKGYNAQHFLLVMIEKIEYALQPSLILVKRLIVLNMISLLRNYILLILITHLLESYTHILIIGFRSQKFQDSILGPLLVNINIIDLLSIEHYRSDFSNYADDTTPYNSGNTFLEVL